MAYDLYTLTPGASVADTIQSILQRRREEARQAMLDRLDEERTRHEMKTRDEQLGLERKRVDYERQRTEGDIAESRQRVLESKRGALPYQGSRADTIADDELKKYLQSTGNIESLQPQGPTETGDALPSVDWYRGSADYQKDQEAQTRLDSLPDEPTLRDLLTARIQPPASMLEPDQPLVEETVGGPRVHPNIVVPRGQRVVTRPQPYFPPAGYASQTVYVPNPNDNGRLWAAWLKPGESPDRAIFIGPAPEGISGSGRGGALSPPANSTGGDRLTQVAAQLANSFTATGPDRDARIATLKSALPVAVPMSPEAQNTVTVQVGRLQQRVEQGKPLPTLDQMMAEVDANYPNLPKKDWANIQRVFSVVLETVQLGR